MLLRRRQRTPDGGEDEGEEEGTEEEGTEEEETEEEGAAGSSGPFSMNGDTMDVK